MGCGGTAARNREPRGRVPSESPCPGLPGKGWTCDFWHPWCCRTGNRAESGPHPETNRKAIPPPLTAPPIKASIPAPTTHRQQHGLSERRSAPYARARARSRGPCPQLTGEVSRPLTVTPGVGYMCRPWGRAGTPLDRHVQVLRISLSEECAKWTLKSQKLPENSPGRKR